MPEKLFINKFQVDFMINDLVDQINKNNEQFTHIVGIANGGLNISKPLANKLKLPHKSITIRFYGDSKIHTEKPKEINFKELEDIDNNHKILLVDDLIDSGISMKYFKNTININHKIAVLYWNKTNKYSITPEYYCYEKPNMWIDFFWETKNGN